MTTFTEDDRKNIIIAAFTAAGKGATEHEVASHATSLVQMLSDGSKAQSVFEELDRQAERTESVSHVSGVVIGIGKESLSNGVERGIVFLRTAVGTHSPEGKEFFRTDILGTGDTPARVYMRQFAGLIGHKVVIEKHLEKMANGSGHKVRVIRGNVRDQGMSADFDHTNVDWQPVFTDPDWVKKLARVAVAPYAAQ